MPRREPPADPTPGPLNVATPDAVDGVVDLRPVLEAACAAAGCGFEDVDPDQWYVCQTWRNQRGDVADRLLADWHGLPIGRGWFVPTETVTLAQTKTHHVWVNLVRGGRGLWLAEYTRHTPHVGPGRGFCPRINRAYVDRDVAICHEARWALAHYDGGPSVRIAAALRRHAGLPEPGPVPG